MTRRTFSVAASSAHDQNWVMRTGWILVVALLACGACDEQGEEEGPTCKDVYECMRWECAEELDASIDPFIEMVSSTSPSAEENFEKAGLRACAAQSCGIGEHDGYELHYAMQTLLICNLPEDIASEPVFQQSSCDGRKTACEEEGGSWPSCKDVYECILEECDSQIELGYHAIEQCAVAACGEFSGPLTMATSAVVSCDGADPDDCKNKCFGT